MNVDDHIAVELMRAFARLEFALKQFPEFIRGQPGAMAETQWSAFYPFIRNDDFIARISLASRDVLLGIDQLAPPPKKMRVNEHRRIEFRDAPLEGNHVGDQLMDAARRVRNNLIHGGKERGIDERYSGHDQQLVQGATEVMKSAMMSHPDVRVFCKAP